MAWAARDSCWSGMMMRRLRSFIEEVIHPCAESDDRKDQEDESHVNILVDDGVPREKHRGGAVS